MQLSLSAIRCMMFFCCRPVNCYAAGRKSRRSYTQGNKHRGSCKFDCRIRKSTVNLSYEALCPYITVFVSTVVFQSILTILFITGLVLKDNQRDAEKELRFEADYSYNSYNTWVLSLWKDIFQIKNDPFVSEGISKYDNEFRTSIYQYFTEFIKSAGLDAVVVKSRDSGDTYIITEKDVNFSVTDLKPLSFIKKHPYIELRVINKDVYLAAFFKLETSDELNVILLKQINSDFYEHMVSSDRSIIFSQQIPKQQRKIKGNRIYQFSS